MTIRPLPSLILYCDSDICKRAMVHAGESPSDPHIDRRWDNYELRYSCQHCQKECKIYAVWAAMVDDAKTVHAVKYGEWPTYGPPVPPKAISLIGGERELFLQGTRAENLDLGVGAFAYYRRVVEDQKDRLLDEIIRVANRVNSPGDVIADLEKAKREFQFSKAIGDVKLSIPESLLISGQNPLLLLHRALSHNLHTESDETCLQLAQSIRVVLYELAERIGQALKDEAELTEAVNRLSGKRKPPDVK